MIDFASEAQAFLTDILTDGFSSGEDEPRLLATMKVNQYGAMVFIFEVGNPDNCPDVYVLRKWCGRWVIVSREVEEDQPEEPFMGYTPGEDRRPERGAFPGEMFRA